MDENLERLWEISRLEENWNGYGAKPISQIILDRAEIIIRNVSVQPEIFPTGRGSIQMQYELPDKSYRSTKRKPMGSTSTDKTRILNKI